MGWSAAAAIISIVAYGSSEKTREEEKNKREASVREQKRSQAESDAKNKAEAAAERRRQVREERVRAARILQQSQNTGVAGSSGETGALSSLSTQLETNVGANAAAVSRAGRISIFQQNAADLDLAANNLAVQAQNYQNFGSSMSSFAMGMRGTSLSSPKPVKTPAPVEDRFLSP